MIKLCVVHVLLVLRQNPYKPKQYNHNKGAKGPKSNTQTKKPKQKTCQPRKIQEGRVDKILVEKTRKKRP
jgi:hypothetical protein